MVQDVTGGFPTVVSLTAGAHLLRSPFASRLLDRVWEMLSLECGTPHLLGKLLPFDGLSVTAAMEKYFMTGSRLDYRRLWF